MLGKLLKYEFGQTSRTLLPIFGGTTVLLLLAKLMAVLNIQYKAPLLVAPLLKEHGTPVESPAVLEILSGLTMFLFVLMVMALLAGTMVVIVNRFYRILGDEGYTMFALPVTPAQHIWSKTICGVTWIVAAAVYFLASVPFVAFTGVPFEQIAIDAIFLWDYGAQGYLLMALLVIGMIAGIWAVLWQIYLACSIGAQFGQRRLAASVGAFFVLQVAMQILIIILVLVVGTIADKTQTISLYQQMRETDVIVIMNTLLGIMIGAIAVVGTVYYCVMRHILTKKLNLA